MLSFQFEIILKDLYLLIQINMSPPQTAQLSTHVRGEDSTSILDCSHFGEGRMCAISIFFLFFILFCLVGKCRYSVSGVMASKSMC